MPASHSDSLGFAEAAARDMAHKLDIKLDATEIRQRPGANGVKVAYLEGWRSISLANEVFGFNGWSSSIVNMHTDYVDVEDVRVSIGVSCTVRVTLRDGTFHEDIGYGSSEKQKNKSDAYSKAKKEAVTDATKRALRYFGNRLGNCMYDKDFLKDLQRSAHHGSTAAVPGARPLAQPAHLPLRHPVHPLPPRSEEIASRGRPSLGAPSEADMTTLIFAEEDYEDFDDALMVAATSEYDSFNAVSLKIEDHHPSDIAPKRKLQSASGSSLGGASQESGAAPSSEARRPATARTDTEASPFRIPAGLAKASFKDPLHLRRQERRDR